MPDSILHFNGEWRSYQKRILDDLDFHLRDDKLHVVAAPGAGKTTLGIEVISRLNRPALILCPTNTIKNQWKDRIRSSFLQKKDYGIVSTDIRKPPVNLFQDWTIRENSDAKPRQSSKTVGVCVMPIKLNLLVIPYQASGRRGPSRRTR